MPCRDQSEGSDAQEMESGLSDTGPATFTSTPDAVQLDINQAGTPQSDMEVPPADIAMDAHMDALGSQATQANNHASDMQAGKA